MEMQALNSPVPASHRLPFDTERVTVMRLSDGHGALLARGGRARCPYRYVDPDGEFLNFAAKFVLDVG